MIQTLLGDYADAFRRKSPDRMADLYSEEGALYDVMGRVFVPGSGGEFHGRKQIALYYAGIFKLIPHNPTPLMSDLVHNRATAVVEMTIERLRTCHIIEVRNDRIMSHRVYLGNLPAKFLLEKLLNS